jgi:hypothetical protein
MRPKWSRSGKTSPDAAGSRRRYRPGRCRAGGWPRNFLRAQVLLDGHRVIGAALHRRIVAHDHALAARNAADPHDDARAGNFIRHTGRWPPAGPFRGTAIRDRAGAPPVHAAAACRATCAARAMVGNLGRCEHAQVGDDHVDDILAGERFG